jgi:ribosomal-protein-alanine N-acetyltransferase
MGCHLPLFHALLQGNGPMMPTLETERLLLRPFRAVDAAAVAALAGDWDVARMTARIPHPYTTEMAEAWIATHAPLLRRGEEYVFCIECDGKVAGCIGLQRSRDTIYELGYWLGKAWWGKGLATEAAKRVVGFALDELGAHGLLSGHLADNPASGRVLEKCGFRYSGDSMEHCEARGEAVAHKGFELMRAGQAGQAGKS